VLVVAALAATTAPAIGREPQPSRLGDILFERNARRACSGEIWSMNGDGSNQRRVAALAAGVCSPRWSPTGKQFAFTRRGVGVFVASVDGTPARLVFSGDTANVDWSPDGSRLAFEWKKRPPLRTEVFLVSIDGSGLFRLAGGDWRDGQPAWSPNGRLIAFVSGRERWPECVRCEALCLIRPDQHRFRRITAKGIHAQTPAWSRDGRWLAWSRSIGVRRRRALMVMTVDTKTVRELAPRGDGPAWHPRGQKLLFTIDGSLFSIGADGRGRTRLTQGPHDANPDWRW
jgi:Tol biopolymer transport system component